jgi:hypothetical protein
MRLRTAGLALTCAVAVVVAGVLIAAWPTTMALVAVVGVGLLLAWRMPPLAIALGLLMLGFEGSVKVLLGLEDSPLPGGNRAAGAAAIDIVLFAGVVAVLVRDRGRTPLAIWRRLGRAERVAVGLLAGWLVVSLPQLAQSAHLTQGLDGLRLFQSYVLVGVAAAVLVTVPWFARRGVVVLLAIGLAVGLYAAVRVVVGAAPAEIALATDTSATTMYGSKVRAVGSFSGAVGLNSYLVPLALFSLVLGMLVPRHRLLAWAVTAVALVPIAASYARTPLLGIMIALALMLVVLLSTADVPVRRKLVILAAAVGALGATYGAIYLASRGTPLLRRRAHGILDPFDDKSMRDRFDAWGRALDRVAADPLGAGVGEAGGSGPSVGLRGHTLDNSFLKVLVDQGVVVGTAFLAGVLLLIVTIARRLRRIEGESRAIGLAALTGFVGFLGLCLVGEAVEQPGKAIAWTLLGIAFAVSLAPVPTPTVAEWIPSWSLAGARRRVAGIAAPAWIAVAAAVVAVPAVIAASRSPGFEASVELIPHSAGPFRATADPEHYRAFLPGRVGRARIERRAGLPITPGPYRSLRLAPAPGGRVRLSARLGSPEDASRFVRGVADHVVAKAENHLAVTAFAARGPIEDRLATHPPPRERRASRERLALLLELAHERPRPVTVGRRSLAAHRTFADRVTESVPGLTPGRPGAFWAGVAGLVVALALWAAALLLAPPRPPARVAVGGGTFAGDGRETGLGSGGGGSRRRLRDGLRGAR